jgi:hypothetical protein
MNNAPAPSAAPSTPFLTIEHTMLNFSPLPGTRNLRRLVSW